MPSEWMVVDATTSMAPVYFSMVAVLAASLIGIVLGSGAAVRAAEVAATNLAARFGSKFVEAKNLVSNAAQHFHVTRSSVAK